MFQIWWYQQWFTLLFGWPIRRDILRTITFLVKTSSNNLMHFISIQNLFLRFFTWHQIATITNNFMSELLKPTKSLFNVEFAHFFEFSFIQKSTKDMCPLVLYSILCTFLRASGITVEWCITTINVLWVSICRCHNLTSSSSNKLRSSSLHYIWFIRHVLRYWVTKPNNLMR